MTSIEQKLAKIAYEAWKRSGDSDWSYLTVAQKERWLNVARAIVQELAGGDNDN